MSCLCPAPPLQMVLPLPGPPTFLGCSTTATVENSGPGATLPGLEPRLYQCIGCATLDTLLDVSLCFGFLPCDKTALRI